MTSLDPDDLAHIASRTIADYDARAEAFWAGTRDHDVRQNIDALLGALRGDPPFTILDLGCGPGRDLRAFTDRGCIAIGVEGSARLAAMARAHSGCEVWEQDFLRLALPQNRFDGIFANASLFHVPHQELPRVLGELHASLRRDGVLFSSNPRGQDEEGWVRGRYGAFHSWDAWQAIMTRSGFAALSHYYRPPGLPREQQPWIASVWRKRDRSGTPS